MSGTTEDAVIFLVTYSTAIGGDPLCNYHPNTDLSLLLLVRQLVSWAGFFISVSKADSPLETRARTM